MLSFTPIALTASSLMIAYTDSRVSAAPAAVGVLATNGTSTSVASFDEGTPVTCTSGGSFDPNAVFRFSNNGTLRFYPNQTIATSWDPSFASINSTDCSSFTRGPDMPLKPSNGQAVACANGNPFNPGTITRYDGAGVLNGYSDPTIAGIWDPNFGNAVNIDCTGFQAGPAMTVPLLSVKNITNGQAIQCTGNTSPTGFANGTVSRFSNGFLRLYPNPSIAVSWDPAFPSSIQKIDCTGLAAGPPMVMKTRAAF